MLSSRFLAFFRPRGKGIFEKRAEEKRAEEKKAKEKTAEYAKLTPDQLGEMLINELPESTIIDILKFAPHANVNYKRVNITGTTGPLITARITPEILKLLIGRNVDINAKSQFDTTVLSQEIYKFHPTQTTYLYFYEAKDHAFMLGLLLGEDSIKITEENYKNIMEYEKIPKFIKVLATCKYTPKSTTRMGGKRKNYNRTKRIRKLYQ